MGSPENSLSPLDGYTAAADKIERILDEAQSSRPKRLKRGYQQRAEYREGYFDGILVASCFLVWGKFPNENSADILKALAELSEPAGTPKDA